MVMLTRNGTFFNKSLGMSGINQVTDIIWVVFVRLSSV